MFKIGEFSKISLISVKTLRYYDQIGLLIPAHVDKDSGYRYYTVEQLSHLNKIIALKDLGLSLEQIKQLLDDNISTEEIRGMLKLKRAQVEQQIQAEMIRLVRIEAKLDFVDREGKMPDAEVVVKAVPELYALTIYEPAPAMDNWAPLIVQTHRALKDFGVMDTPSSMAVFHGNQYNHELVDWELAFPLEHRKGHTVELEKGRRLSPKLIPGVPDMACIIHRGSYHYLDQAYASVAHWVQNNDYQICGAGREVYLKIGFLEGLEKRDDNVTEIQFPIQSIRV